MTALHAESTFEADQTSQPTRRVDLAVVVPTYNEYANIPEFIGRLEAALDGLHWELLFVDDDSPDGTAELVRHFAQRDGRIRLLHRIGRRGLATACIEGVLATAAPVIAVMDADLQHDETILPRMLQTLRSQSLDVVVGTRNSGGGSMGSMQDNRVALSQMGRKLSYAVCRCQLSDPMSGYFLLRRDFFMEVAHKLRGNGFKILVDIFASSSRAVRFGEVGYSFRERRHGESKLDVRTGIEYLFLILNKLTNDVVPTRFAVFAAVGSLGVVLHLAILTLLLRCGHMRFFSAQALATYGAMTVNFFLNNLITYSDRRLRGLRLATGWLTFCMACSFGAWANLVFSGYLLGEGARWYLAGIAGVVLSSVWNYSMTHLFTWQVPENERPLCGEPEPFAAEAVSDSMVDSSLFR